MKKMLSEQHVAIVGLGLMGGSLAMALRPHIARLSAVDTDPAACEQALAQGLVDRAMADLKKGVAAADLIVLATPVRAILRQLAELPRLRPDGCLVLDLGSTKGQICAAMAGLPAQFAAVGGHPLCGRETAGLTAASADLYRGQTFVLCRNRRTTPAVEQLALNVIAAIGARPLFLPADAHDELVAVTSHLPYLVSAALMQVATVAAADDKRIWQVSASGFRDTTRLAGSDPEMMLDILLTNRAAVLEQLKQYRQALAGMIELLHSEDEVALRRWLEEGQRQHGVFSAVAASSAGHAWDAGL